MAMLLVLFLPVLAETSPKQLNLYALEEQHDSSLPKWVLPMIISIMALIVIMIVTVVICARRNRREASVAPRPALAIELQQVGNHA